MKKEQLEQLGLSEEQIREVFKINGLDIEGLKNSKANLEQEKIRLEAENENLKTNIATANSTIENFKKMDIETIKKEADDYKTKYNDSISQHEKEIAKLKANHNIALALNKAKVRNDKAAKALLDMEALENAKDFDAELENQINSLKESDGYLFTAETPEDPMGFSGDDSGGLNKPLTYSEMIAQLDKNPNAKF